MFEFGAREKKKRKGVRIVIFESCMKSDSKCSSIVQCNTTEPIELVFFILTRAIVTVGGCENREIQQHFNF